jgi:hypothetical protein
VRLAKSSAHDGDMAPMIIFVCVIIPYEHLPTIHIPYDRLWWKGPVMPMGGRIIFELLFCRESVKSVRININDGITALLEYSSGPVNSCSLDEFAVLIARKGREAGRGLYFCINESSGGAIENPEGFVFAHGKGIAKVQWLLINVDYRLSTY